MLSATSSGESLKSTVAVAFIFLVLFTAFNGTQNLLSSIYEDMGNTCLAIIYLSFALSSLIIATPAVTHFGPKNMLVFGAVAYTAFQIANVYPEPYTLYPLSAVLGVGAAMIWTSQGVYQTLCSTPESTGRHSGIFFMIFQTSQIIGNLASSVIMHAASERLLFVVYALCGGVATIAMLFLPSRRMPKDENESSKVPATTQQQQQQQQQTLDFYGSQIGVDVDDVAPLPGSLAHTLVLVRRAFTLLRTDRVIQLAVLSFVWSGVSLGIYYSWFTGQWVKPHLGKSNVGYVMSTFGAMDIVCSYGFGYLSDRVGRATCVLAGTVCIMLSSMAIALRASATSVPSWEVYVVAGLMGVGDAAYNTMIQSYLSGLFGSRSTEAFSVFRTVQAACAAVAMFTASRIDTVVLMCCVCVLVVVAFVGFFVGERRAERKMHRTDDGFTIVHAE